MFPLPSHPHYQSTRQAAEESHRNQRSLAGVSDSAILLARLYAYGFRGQIIGAFHATAEALVGLDQPGPASCDLAQAIEELRSLGALSLEAVPNDFRAVLGLFYRYERGLARILRALAKAIEAAPSDELQTIRRHFARAMERVTGSSGIAIARDDEIPEQASLVVPGLGITLIPLVYGDQHSWNLAFLSGKNLDVPRHLHREGIEIHLGLGALHGETCLGGCRAEVTEGYAMPIPPGAPHAFINRARHEHRLPFIFGSRRLGGWGIIPDVEPRPVDPADLASREIRAEEMNGTVLLDREIEAAAQSPETMRRTLISPERTFSPAAGGLHLSIARVGRDGMVCESDRFRIVSVVRGRGRVTIGPAEADLFPHAHFGIPAGARATIAALDREPLVLLDAVLVEEITYA